MKKIILITALLFLSCTKETIVENETCNCKIRTTEQIVIWENGLPHSGLRTTYENTDIIDCDMDGVIIQQTNVITKEYVCD